MNDGQEYDLLGIGFGPANLALAIALRESAEAGEVGTRFRFVERQSAFGWHSSLLLPGAQLQVSPMKDLATMRDPTSSYTFTNYLHQQGRLAAFVNREAGIPSRREWSAYLHWAAKRMEDVVDYGQEVVSVEPDHSSPSSIDRLRVTTRDLGSGQFVVRYAKNITVAVGGVPVVPSQFDALYPVKGSNVIHSCTYLPSLATMEPQLRTLEAARLAVQAQDADKLSTPAILSTSLEQQQRQSNAPLRFAVVGSGQSAAEISLHLRKTFPLSHVSLIFRASALVPSDDSAFVNASAFDPERTDAFWRAGDEERKAWLTEFRRTNYSVVRSDVLNELHNEVYDQSIELAQPWPNADGPTTHGRLELRPNTQIDVAVQAGDEQSPSIMLTLRDLKYPTAVEASERTEPFDAVILATGFTRGPDCMSFLKPLQKYYPRLDVDVQTRKAALGFGVDELDSLEALAGLQADGMAAERLRQRSRGITRDYRLVSYSSDAFAPTLAVATLPSSSSSSSSPLIAAAPAYSGTSTPRRDSDLSDSDTLADSEEHLIMSFLSSRRESRDESAALDAASEQRRQMRGPKINASIYFLGGNEATHGLSDSLLSIVAHRAGELSRSLVKRQQAQRTRQRGETIAARKATLTGADCAPVAATLQKLSADSVDTVQERMGAIDVA